MSDTRDHPTAGRWRRRKNPAVGYLAPPALPDHLKDDEDGPTRRDEEKGAKQMRSASTTPRSFRGTDPDDYDRVMGVTSVGPQETVRFGEEHATEFEVDQEGVANNSDNLNEAREESNPHTENAEDDPGAGRSSRGFGRVSFLEFLDRVGERLNPAIPATPRQKQVLSREFSAKWGAPMSNQVQPSTDPIPHPLPSNNHKRQKTWAIAFRRMYIKMPKSSKRTLFPRPVPGSVC